MTWYPYNPLLGQEMQTGVSGVTVDRGFISHFQVVAANAVAASNDGVHDSINASGDSVVTVEDGFTNPAVPRNITATAGGTAGDVKAVQITVTGTNYNDEVITEDLPAFTVDTTGTVTGSKAFKTVTKVEIPAMDGSGVTITIGWGDKLGLPFALSHNTVLAAFLDNSLEGTAPSVATSATAIESNTVDLNSALNDKQVDVYLIV